jgi:hypothetical protein
VRRYAAPRSVGARERVLRRLKDWAARQIEKRIHAEWEEYRQVPRVKAPLFGRRRSPDGTHTSRSLIEINFHRR